MAGYCPNVPCAYAHHDRVTFASPLCDQFGKLGFCEVGPTCSKIHWQGLMAEFAECAQRAQQRAETEQTREAELQAAKRKLLQRMKSRHVSKVTGTAEDKARTRLLSGDLWSEKVEEFVLGQSRGELALQEDFVPF